MNLNKKTKVGGGGDSSGKCNQRMNLLVLIRKARIGKSLLRKHIGFSVIKDNLDEFEAAKERVDQVQEEEKLNQR